MLGFLFRESKWTRRNLVFKQTLCFSTDPQSHHLWHLFDTVYKSTPITLTFAKTQLKSGIARHTGRSVVITASCLLPEYGR
jgi:hypothetical protein